VLNHHTSKNHKIFSIKDPVVRKFIHKNLRGGRVQCLKPHFSSFDNLTINFVEKSRKDKKTIRMLN
jgi:hypothetical protein